MYIIYICLYLPTYTHVYKMFDILYLVETTKSA